jgi:hypothetical protein
MVHEAGRSQNKHPTSKRHSTLDIPSVQSTNEPGYFPAYAKAAFDIMDPTCLPLCTSEPSNVLLATGRPLKVSRPLRVKRMQI